MALNNKYMFSCFRNAVKVTDESETVHPYQPAKNNRVRPTGVTLCAGPDCRSRPIYWVMLRGQAGRLSPAAD